MAGTGTAVPYGHKSVPSQCELGLSVPRGALEGVNPDSGSTSLALGALPGTRRLQEEEEEG